MEGWTWSEFETGRGVLWSAHFLARHVQWKTVLRKMRDLRG